MNGKDKCRILKDIRKQIAQENDIDLIIAECTHKGDCRGTCPRCEAEVEYLERELQRRRSRGARVALAGVSAGLSLALAGCAPVDTLIETTLERIAGPSETAYDLSGVLEPSETPIPTGLIESEPTPVPTYPPVETTGMPTEIPSFEPEPTQKPEDEDTLDGEIAPCELIDDEQGGAGV